MTLVCTSVGGAVDDNNSDRNEILELKDGSWIQVAAMIHARAEHAVSIINVENYLMFCK